MRILVGGMYPETPSVSRSTTDLNVVPASGGSKTTRTPNARNATRVFRGYRGVPHEVGVSGNHQQEHDCIQPSVTKFVEMTSKNIASAYANQVKTALRREDIAPVKEKLNELQGQLGEQQGHIQVLVGRVDEIRVARDHPGDYVAETRRITQEIAGLGAKVTAAEKDNRDLHVDVGAMEARVDELQGTVNGNLEGLRTEVLDLSAVVVRTEQNCSQLDDSVAGFERELHDVGADLRRVSADILALKANALNEGIRESDLNGLRGEHDSLWEQFHITRVEHELLSETVEASLPNLVEKTRFLDGNRFEDLEGRTDTLAGKVDGLNSLPGRLQELENMLGDMKREDLQFRAGENRKTNGMFMTIGRLEKLVGGDDLVERMRKVVTMAAELVEVTQAGMARSDKRTAHGKYALDANKQARRLLHFANTMELKDLDDFCDDPLGDRITPVHRRKRRRVCRRV